METNIEADVAFDQRSEAKSVRGHSVLAVLAAIREVVGLAVLPELETELARRFGMRFGFRVETPKGPAPAR